MDWFTRFRYRNFSQTEPVNELLTEVFRKSIHISAAATAILAQYWYFLTLIGIIVISILYCISEILRMYGHDFFCIAKITRYAARRRDKGHFVLGPITLAAGVSTALVLFPLHTAKIAIFALAFGDGLASLIGKRFGRHHLNIAKDKTLAGSLACFSAVFISTLTVSLNIWKSGVLAFAAACIEMLPLKDYDNILIPVAIGFLALFLHA